ncbi:sensor histidine kinase [Enterococcus sp. LJL120]
MSYAAYVVLNWVYLLGQLVMIAIFVKQLNGVPSQRSFVPLLYVGYALASSLLGSSLVFSEIEEKGYYDLSVFVLVLAVLMQIVQACFIHYLYPLITRRVIFSAGVFLLAIVEFVESLQNIIVPNFFNAINFPYLVKLLLTVGPSLGIMAILILLKRSNFYKVLRKSLPSFRFIFIFMVAYFVLETAFSFFTNFLIEKVAFWRPLYALNNLFLIFVIFIIFWQYFREKKFANAELLRLQQQNYLQRLEKVQLELRKVHHDYKNVATGLYAQVEAGDLAGAKKYLNEKFLQLDQNLQLDIQQMNQLAQVEVAELKALLLSKLMLAEKNGVNMTLEVLLPVTNVAIEISDLLRCLGIVLDNAIEAAEVAEVKTVQVLFLQESEVLTMSIKNATCQQVDLQKIFHAGYSTKGSNRGLGLSILKEISRRYHNFFVETRLEAGYFQQILLLHGTKAN